MSRPETGPRIIVIDAQEGLRWLYQHWLEADGYRAQVAGDRTALDALLAGPAPDLILIDLHLGGLDGIRACRDLRADPRLEGIPIIGTSHEVAGLSSRLGKSSGADSVLVKPFSRIELELAVRAALGLGDGAGSVLTRPNGNEETDSGSGTGCEPSRFLAPKLEDGTC